MVTVRQEIPADAAARERILDRCFGAARFEKTCERLRAGRRPAGGLSLVAERDGQVVGTVRLWHVRAGTAGRALLLGPLAVDCEVRGAGVGAALMREALARAARLGHEAVLLVGDAPYYKRFGFSADLTAALTLPGPVERARFLGLELAAGALAGAQGPVAGMGERDTRRGRTARLRVPRIDFGARLAA
jgi:predicted N-acetyltransferase YhbS